MSPTARKGNFFMDLVRVGVAGVGHMGSYHLAALSELVEHRVFAKHGEWVRHCEFSPDGARIATSSQDGAATAMAKRWFCGRQATGFQSERCPAFRWLGADGWPSSVWIAGAARFSGRTTLGISCCGTRWPRHGVERNLG